MPVKFMCHIPLRYALILFTVLYLTSTCFALFKLFYSSREQSAGNPEQNSLIPQLSNLGKPYLIPKNVANNQPNFSLPIIEIWGKAAIGMYLWKHVLGGEVAESGNSWYSYGSLSMGNMSFVFRSGPGVVPNTVPLNVQYLILVVNGRSENKITAAKIWLESLHSYSHLKKVILVVLGNEKCDNAWLLPYMKSKGGVVNAAFLVYDSTLVDNREFFQWPLGVATYRGFPNLQEDEVDLLSSRPYLCNFLGTVYKNSSRETLLDVVKINNIEDECLVLGRQKWSPLETEFTLQRYISALHKSDLTLSPVGENTECYRIYESLSLGSVPVVEDVVTPGNCDRNQNIAPLRLLKDHGAPLIYIKNWSALPGLLSEERLLTLEEKVQRRLNTVQWYKHFKIAMRDVFIGVISKVFFA
ncbi:ribitol-5-phosphate xylosyltransferase 1-like [Ischnura elegans]|uniref:ribitol-5-phosphate xylosyltransferase 1-like n=1 Tax=Ischnura elegans TaxID=197161 RepID=UPI001ED8918F|nr:ribitol-5-phosphate xylosyltransferase 1-like [Ischnura elegans]